MMNTDTNILVVGDSMAAGRECGTDIDAGWPEMLNIPQAYRQGISGSTAESWSIDEGGRLTRAVQTPADILILSLLANTILVAYSDGQVTEEEMSSGVWNMRAVVKALLRKTTIVFLYADPFCGADSRFAYGITMLNMLIRTACLDMPVIFADLGKWLLPEHFNGIDVHPNRAGYAAIAAGLTAIIQEQGGDPS